MATQVPIVLFYQSQKTYSVDTIIFDLILKESHSLDASITSFNVEDGSLISDHIKNELRTGSLTGKVTNFSIYEDGFPGNKALEAWEKFKELWAAKKKMTINCIMDSYDDVCVVHVGSGREPGLGEAQEFDVSFQQMNIVKLEQISLNTTISLDNTNTNNTNLNRQSNTNLDRGKIITTGGQ